MTRITDTFLANKKMGTTTFITYTVCGDPNMKSSLNILDALVESGVDIIELGVPFSDPIADGPVIQRAVERTLKNKVSLYKTLNLVRLFRKKNKDTPIVLMGYMNPIEKMGYRRFSTMANQAGIDGVLVVDLPPEESEKLTNSLKKNNIDQIFLASPTTDDLRLKKIVRQSSGYVYYVSLKGITGSKISNIKMVKNMVGKIKKFSNLDIPVAVGFGIKNAESAKRISTFSDGIIIGSSIVELIEKHHNTSTIMIKKIKSFTNQIRRVLNKK